MKKFIDLPFIILLSCTPSWLDSKPIKHEKLKPSSLSKAKPVTKKISPESYLQARKALNYCKTQDDCTQIWPGACPHGPYFINAKADVSQVFAMEKSLEASSEIECEPPIYLSTAGCQKGKCVAGARSALNTKKNSQSCRDTPIVYLQNNGAESARLYQKSNTSSPLLIYQVPTAGKLRLRITWPRKCTDCVLQISEHNSAMTNLVKGQRERIEHIETIELSVTSGSYYFRGMSASSKTFLLRIQHRDHNRKSPMAGAHGRGMLRFCNK